MWQLWILPPNSCKQKKGKADFQLLMFMKCQHWFIHYLHKACIDLLLLAFVEVINAATDHPPIIVLLLFRRSPYVGNDVAYLLESVLLHPFWVVDFCTMQICMPIRGQVCQSVRCKYYIILRPHANKSIQAQAKIIFNMTVTVLIAVATAVDRYVHERAT